MLKTEITKEFITQNNFHIEPKAADRPASQLARLLYLHGSLPDPTAEAYRKILRTPENC